MAHGQTPPPFRHARCHERKCLLLLRGHEPVAGGLMCRRPRGLHARGRGLTPSGSPQLVLRAANDGLHACGLGCLGPALSLPCNESLRLRLRAPVQWRPHACGPDFVGLVARPLSCGSAPGWQPAPHSPAPMSRWLVAQLQDAH